MARQLRPQKAARWAGASGCWKALPSAEESGELKGLESDRQTAEPWELLEVGLKVLLWAKVLVLALERVSGRVER